MEQKETFLHFKQGEKNQSPIKQEMSMWWAQRTVTESSCVRCCGNPSSLACTRQPAKAGPCPWEWAAPMMPSRLTKALGWSDILWFQRLKLWFSFRTRTSLSDLQRITAETPTTVPWITVILMVLTPTTSFPLTQWQLSYTTNYGIFRASGSLFWMISMSRTQD